MNPFTECIKKVEDWLPSIGFARVMGRKRSWNVSLTEGYLKGETVKLVLPETFLPVPSSSTLTRSTSWSFPMWNQTGRCV